MTEPFVQELAWRPPHEAFHAFSDEAFALYLDSATAGPGHDPALHGRWSFIAADPVDRLTTRTAGEPAPFTVLKQRLAALPPVVTRPGLPPFIGGAAGFFGYGLGRTLEHLPPETSPFAVDDQHLPDMALGFYDTVLAFDMIDRRAWVVSIGTTERATRMRVRFERAGPMPQLPQVAPATVASNFTRAGYERAVASVIGYIYAGDIFQANLSQRFEARLSEGDTPYALYLRLRAASPRLSALSSISARVRSFRPRPNVFSLVATARSKPSRSRAQDRAGYPRTRTAALPQNCWRPKRTVPRT